MRPDAPKSRLDTLYGINAVKEAVGSRPVDYVLVTEGRHGPRVEEIVQLCRRRGVPVRFAPAVAVDRAAGTSQHQNVVAACAAKAYEELEALVSTSPTPLLVVLDGVEDPAN